MNLKRQFLPVTTFVRVDVKRLFRDKVAIFFVFVFPLIFLIIFGLMVWVFFVRFSVPVLGVFYGTSLMADEVEDKTITYLFTRPIPRGAVLVGKYLAYLACTVCVEPAGSPWGLHGLRGGLHGLHGICTLLLLKFYLSTKSNTSAITGSKCYRRKIIQ